MCVYLQTESAARASLFGLSMYIMYVYRRRSRIALIDWKGFRKLPFENYTYRERGSLGAILD